MKSLSPLSIVLWIVMWIAFCFDSPLGFVIPMLGLAAAVATAIEPPGPRVAQRRRRVIDAAVSP